MKRQYHVNLAHESTYLQVCQLPFAISERNVQQIRHELQPRLFIWKKNISWILVQLFRNLNFPINYSKPNAVWFCIFFKLNGSTVFFVEKIFVFSAKKRYLSKTPRFINEPATSVWNLGKIYSHRKKAKLEF